MLQKPLNLLLCVILVAQLALPPLVLTAAEARTSLPQPASRTVVVDAPTSPPDGAPQGASDTTAPAMTMAEALSAAPQRLPFWRSLADYPYLSSLYTHSDILIFSYHNATQLRVTTAGGALLWSGVLNAGQRVALTPGAGIYMAAASQPFSVVVGDQLTDYVWGYYAMDQNGRGLSTLLHTYQADWGSTRYDPHFVVFAYQDNTQVTVRDSETGVTIWSGALDDGEHYDNPALDDRFLTVSATKPVSALSYTDQGYFVPSENGTFAGRRFHTYVGNAGGWPAHLNIMAYDNTGVTVTDSASGDFIWSGSLPAGQAKTIPGLNGRFVTVESSGIVTVSAQPAPYLTPGGYYHSLYAQDATGTGIGTNFLLPAIAGGALVFFAYDNGSAVTIRDDDGNLVYSGTLNQGDWDAINSSETYYTIRSTGRISAVFDWGNAAGADFAPVFYATLNVQVITPNGDSYAHGESMTVSAYVTHLGQKVLNAGVTGRIEVSGPSDTLTFTLNDDGLYGDDAAGDAIYSAEVPLPHAAAMPDGNYDVYITAQRPDANGVMQSGTAVSNFTVAGANGQAPVVAAEVIGPQAGAIYSGDTVTIRAAVDYQDGIDRPGTAVVARITQPTLTQLDVTLTPVSEGLWETTWTVPTGGRYLFDIRATPPADAPFATGYDSVAVNALASAAALALTVDQPPPAFARGTLASLGVTVRAGGLTTGRANVFAEISPGDIILPFKYDGDGHYTGAFQAVAPGRFTATIYASVPYFADNSATTSFTVSNAGEDLVNGVNKLADSTVRDMDRLLATTTEVAQDGDWFRSKTGGDLVAIGFDILFGVFGVYHDASKVLDSVKVDGLIRGYTPGLDGLRWLKHMTGSDGRVYRSWATRTTHALRESLLDPHFTGRLYPEHLGPDVFGRALLVYAASFAHTSVEELAKLKVSEKLQVAAEGLFGRPLETGVLSFVRDDVTEFKQLLNSYAADTLSDVPPIADEDAYLNDFVAREKAHIYIAGNAHNRNITLFWARDHREANEGLVRQFILVLLHQALRLLVGVLTGGPGVLVVDGVWTSVELISDVKKLHEDIQMWNFAANSVLRSYEDESRIYFNAVTGLAQLRRAAPPRTARGDIVAIQALSRRGLCWRVVCEQEVVSRITIRNTGPETARFRPEACFSGTRQFGLQFFGHCVQNVRLNDGANDLTVTVPPSQQVTVELVFKDENGHDVRPPDGTSIAYYLYAENDTGIFLADYDDRALEPEHQYRSGLYATNRPDRGRPAAIDNEVEVIPHPIYLAALPGGGGVDQYFHLEAVNGYGFPIQATIVQRVPGGAPVTIPGGGLVSGDTITWKTVIQPREGFTAEFALALPGSLSESVDLPPAELSFYTAQDDALLTFYSTGVTVPRRPVWTATATLPPRLDEASAIPFEVQNWSQTQTSGALRVRLHNQQGQIIRTAELPVTLCGNCSSTETVPFGVEVQPGVYALTAELRIGEDIVQVDSRLLTKPAGEFRLYVPVTTR